MRPIESMSVPSGRMLTSEQVELLRRFHELGTVMWSDTPFKLKSGIESHVYVLARQELTQNPDVLKEVGRQISRAFWLDAISDCEHRSMCIIGIPTAGTPLAAAASLMSRDGPTGFKLMREVKKTHGTNQLWVEGKPQPADYRYATIENVVTSGQSIEEANLRLAEDGYPVKDMVHYVLVDRQQGGVERLRELGYKVNSLFYLSDIAFVFAELGLWDTARAKSVEAEISAHHFS